MHYYTFYVKDYMSKTSFLEPLEDVAYRRMLDYIYLNEMPLPVDISEIAKKINMRTHSECIAYVLQEFFELTNDGWINDRVAQEISKYQEKSDKARKSAEARWKKKGSNANDINASDDSMRTHSDGNANAMRNECEGNANYKLLTINNELTNESVIEEEKFKFDDFWNLYNKKVGKAHCEKKWSKLTNSEKELILQRLPAYIAITNDVQYRKNPLTYLNGKHWEDEIVSNNSAGKTMPLLAPVNAPKIDISKRFAHLKKG